MQIVFLILAVATTVAAPYTLIMAMPKTSHAVMAGAAIAVPTLLAYRHAELPVLAPHDWIFGIDSVLITAALISIAVAVFTRVLIQVLGERARRPAALVAINILGLALVASALPWLPGLIGLVAR